MKEREVIHGEREGGSGSWRPGRRPRQSALSAPVSTRRRHGPALRARRRQSREPGGSQAAWMSGPSLLCLSLCLPRPGQDRQGTCLESEDNTSLVPFPTLHPRASQVTLAGTNLLGLSDYIWKMEQITLHETIKCLAPGKQQLWLSGPSPPPPTHYVGCGSWGGRGREDTGWKAEARLPIRCEQIPRPLCLGVPGQKRRRLASEAPPVEPMPNEHGQ